ncbi:MAG: hypothetical protein LBG96_15535 [Tannerella sp.]|nr:hypothetical protein [Tannerella sp.]
MYCSGAVSRSCDVSPTSSVSVWTFSSNGFVTIGSAVFVATTQEAVYPKD